MVGVGTFAPAGALLTAFAVKAQLAGAVTPADHVTRALASSSSSSECAVEIGACAADTACVACGEQYRAQLEACSESLTPKAGDVCGSVEDLLCCATDGCQDNDAYVALFGCDPVVAVGECGLVDLITCAEGGSAPADSITADDTSATTTVCAAEQEACYEDSACLLCLQTLADEARAVVEVCHPPDYAGVEAPCSEKEEVACCFVEKGPECLSSDLFVAFTGCEVAAGGCDFIYADCVDSGGSSALLGGDDDEEAEEADGAEADEEPEDSSALVGGDGDEGEEGADAVEVDEDEEAKDADVADADADSATRSAMVGGTTTLIVTSAVSWALVTVFRVTLQMGCS